MAINTSFLPKNVQAAIAANPDLYKRSITPAMDRAHGRTFNLGSEDEQTKGWGLMGPADPDTLKGSTRIELADAWNGQGLLDNLGWVPLDNTIDFTDRRKWKPGAEQAILGATKWVDNAGLLADYGVMDKWAVPPKDSFMDKLVPGLILGAAAYGIGGGLLSAMNTGGFMPAGGAAFDSATMFSGGGGLSGGAGGAVAGGGAGGAGALAAEGATGLASLPAAGTWAQTAIPAVGAGAGSWTLPASLAGIEGATTVAGGFTMADAIRNGMQNLPVDIGDGLTSLVPDGAYDTPLPDTTQWHPPNYPGRKSFLESIKELIKPTPSGPGGGGDGGSGGGMNFSDWLNLGDTVAGIGTSIWSGNKQADAASDAAKLQAAGQAAALEELKRQFDLSRADQMPWLTAGKDSLAQLAALMAPGGALTRKFGAADFEADPGYRFQLAEGEQAANRAAAARGGFNSGRTLKELMRYGQGLASTTYQDAYNRYNTDQSNLYNRLAGIAGTGQTAATTLGNAGANYAANVGNTLTGGANAQAASRIAGANARTSGYMGAANAITGGINNYQQSQLLSQLLRQYGA